MRIHARLGDAIGAVDCLKAIRRSGLQAERVSINSPIKVFKNTADIAGAKILLEEMKGAGLEPDMETPSSENKQIQAYIHE